MSNCGKTQLGQRTIWVLNHSCKVDSNLAIPQNPAIGKAHLTNSVFGSHRNLLGNHERFGVFGFSPKNDVGFQAVDAQNALHVFLHLLTPFVNDRRFHKTADEKCIVRVLVKKSFNILIQNVLNMLTVHIPQFSIRYVFHEVGNRGSLYNLRIKQLTY